MRKLTIRFLWSNLIKYEVVANDFLTGFFAQSLYVFFKRKLIVIFITRNFSLHVLESFSYKYPPDDFFISKKKVKFMWIHFLTFIFRNHKIRLSATPLFHNFINYLKFWTATRCKWTVIICITYQVDIWKR